MILASGPGLVGTGENPAGVTGQDIPYLVTIREWREGHDPNPTMLRRMAETLVKIAVDYVVEIPGVISTNTARGKALLSLLEAFENIDFAEDGRAEILEGLLTAALETLRDYPGILAKDERARMPRLLPLFLLHGSQVEKPAVDLELVAGGEVVVGGPVAVLEFDDLHHPGKKRPRGSRMVVGDEIVDGEIRFGDTYEMATGGVEAEGHPGESGLLSSFLFLHHRRSGGIACGCELVLARGSGKHEQTAGTRLCDTPWQEFAIE